MLTIAISLLFGLVAFAALAQIRSAVRMGFKRGRLIQAELSSGNRKPVRAKSALQPGAQARRPELATA